MIEQVKTKKIEQGTEEKKVESKEEKKTAEKSQTEKIKKKTQAIAYGRDMHISTKQCMYISKAIKGKRIDAAIAYLNQVIMMKKAVPFKGEIPHRKGRIMSGRYPVKASKLVINILKGLKGNAIVNGLDLDKTVISESCANSARRPARSGGRQAKRTHLMIIAKEIKSQNQDSKKKQEAKK